MYTVLHLSSLQNPYHDDNGINKYHTKKDSPPELSPNWTPNLRPFCYLCRSRASPEDLKASTSYLCLLGQTSHLPFQTVRGDPALLQLMMELRPLVLEGFNFFSQRCYLFLIGLRFQFKTFFKKSRQQKKKIST